jgi:anti-sigma regulatory factor (Ser/Thr protein kinase)
VNETTIGIPAKPASLAQARGFVDAQAQAADLDPEARYQLTMAVNEAVSNAIEHGRPLPDGTIQLSAVREGSELAFYVRDGGDFSLEASVMRDLDPAVERGRGFAVMNLLVDDVHVDPSGATVVRLAKRLPGGR